MMSSREARTAGRRFSIVNEDTVAAIGLLVSMCVKGAGGLPLSGCLGKPIEVLCKRQKVCWTLKGSLFVLTRPVCI